MNDLLFAMSASISIMQDTQVDLLGTLDDVPQEKLDKQSKLVLPLLERLHEAEKLLIEQYKIHEPIN